MFLLKTDHYVYMYTLLVRKLCASTNAQSISLQKSSYFSLCKFKYIGFWREKNCVIYGILYFIIC